MLWNAFRPQRGGRTGKLTTFIATAILVLAFAPVVNAEDRSASTTVSEPDAYAATADAIAAAIATPSAHVTSASFVTTPSANANGIQPTPLGEFPLDGDTFGVLTSGLVTSVATPHSFASTNLGGGNVRGNTDFDVTVLKIGLDVPSGANCLTFDFKFLSEEYSFYVGSPYNDAFIAELDSSTWTTNGHAISAPNNFAFDEDGNVVSINSTGLGGMSAAAGAGTAFDGPNPYYDPYGGATGLLKAASPISAGAHDLYLSIFDQSDHVLDSAVFLDKLAIGFVPEPLVNCKPGADVENFDLKLTPATDTAFTGTSHMVTATLTNVATGFPIADVPISFAVSGANSATGSGTTDASGNATFSYTGTAVGTDSIGACYDADATPPCEATAAAEMIWTNAPPTANAGGPYAGNEGAAVALDGTATDSEGDTLTSSWTYEVVSADAGVTCAFDNAAAVDTKITCTDDGTFTVKLTVNDGYNADVVSTASLTLDNVAPTVSITTPAGGTLLGIGANVNLSAAFGDAGTNDTHTCSVAWDDGTSTTGMIVESAGAGTCNGSHSFAAAGVYTVKVTVTDDNGGIGTATVMLIVYDPSAGFVTGGGWINSPAGAYTADASLVGKANFGFVSKYQKGATVPTGQTEFQFQTAGFNFHSDAYQWLVVAGSKAQYKGTGSVNGVSGYGFLLTATDGQISGGGGVDKFRLKVWSTATSQIVYDNVLGASDDIDAAAPLAIAGGQIVIHK